MPTRIAHWVVVTLLLPGCLLERVALTTKAQEIDLKVDELRNKGHAEVEVEQANGNESVDPPRTYDLPADQRVRVMLDPPAGSSDQVQPKQVQLSIAKLIENCPNAPRGVDNLPRDPPCRLLQVNPEADILVVDKHRLDWFAVGFWGVTAGYLGAIGGLTYCAFECSDQWRSPAAAGAIVLGLAGVVIVKGVLDGLGSLLTPGAIK